jgi:hypothetical protein
MSWTFPLNMHSTRIRFAMVHCAGTVRCGVIKPARCRTHKMALPAVDALHTQHVRRYKCLGTERTSLAVRAAFIGRVGCLFNSDTHAPMLLLLNLTKRTWLTWCRDLGILRVELAQIAAAVLPSPKRCLEAIHVLLPELSSEVYTRFITRVHEATRRLSAVPTCVEEFVEYLRFIQIMEDQRQAFDEEADMVSAPACVVAGATAATLARWRGSSMQCGRDVFAAWGSCSGRAACVPTAHHVLNGTPPSL